VAVLDDGVWRIEAVVSGGEMGLTGVAAALHQRPYLAYTPAGGVAYAWRSASLDVETAGSEPPPPAWFTSGGYYNPLDACQAILDLLGGGSGPPTGRAGAASQLTLPLGHTLADEALFGGLHRLFSTSAAGQRYIDLYRQYGAEMGRIGLDDPALLWDAFGALQNFLPGLDALVTGRGDEIMVTQELVDDALAIWQRLAADASPALAAAIQAELDSSDNLQTFVGMTFAEWAAAIGVDPHRSYLPVVAGGVR
jgi:hypothetical protein